MLSVEKISDRTKLVGRKIALGFNGSFQEPLQFVLRVSRLFFLSFAAHL